MSASTLPELFSAAGPLPANEPLLVLPGGGGITRGELERMSAKHANVLLAAGVGPADRIAVQVEKSPEALALYLACLRIGAVLLPMNPSYTSDEVAYLLGDASPSLVVADPAAPAAASEGHVLTLGPDGTGTLVEAAAEADATVEDVVLEASSPAVLLYTSGTTGRPKGALLTQGNLASNAAALVEAWGFSSNDVLLHALPIFHIHGLLVATNTALASGAKLLFLPRFEVDAVLEGLRHSTVMMGVPTYYHRLLASPELDGACSGVRLFVSGSAPLSSATFTEFERRTGHRILERYGMTETSMIASNPLRGERRPGTVGAPLPGVEVRIVEDATGAALPVGEIGAIEVRGPNVFGGYFGRPELNATEFRADGFFRTGDLGVLDADGYLAIVGRSKDLVISGGLNVYPKEIEEAIDALPGVAESAVVGLPDEDFGEAVVAAVVVQLGVALDPAALRKELRQHLAGYKVPKRVFLVEALPRNAMGKVEKAVLRQHLRALS